MAVASIYHWRCATDVQPYNTCLGSSNPIIQAQQRYMTQVKVIAGSGGMLPWVSLHLIPQIGTNYSKANVNIAKPRAVVVDQ